MNKYQRMQKHQNTFFTSAEDVLAFYKEIEVKQNKRGLYYLTICGSFKASFPEEEKEDAILFYGNQLVQRILNKVQ